RTDLSLSYPYTTTPFNEPSHLRWVVSLPVVSLRNPEHYSKSLPMMLQYGLYNLENVKCWAPVMFKVAGHHSLDGQSTLASFLTKEVSKILGTLMFKVMGRHPLDEPSTLTSNAKRPSDLGTLFLV
ncbi:hypothetical protein HAX54_041663, partial [Datura stramonium]|nr:hypothetical protein [Datura stramonium]